MLFDNAEATYWANELQRRQNAGEDTDGDVYRGAEAKFYELCRPFLIAAIKTFDPRPWAAVQNDLEDLVHDTFLHVLNRLDRWDPSIGAKLHSWLTQIVRNRCTDNARKRSSQQQQLPDMLDTEQPPSHDQGDLLYEMIEGLLPWPSQRHLTIVLTEILIQSHFKHTKKARSRIVDELQAHGIDINTHGSHDSVAIAVNYAVRAALMKISFDREDFERMAPKAAFNPEGILTIVFGPEVAGRIRWLLCDLNVRISAPRAR